MKFLIGLILGGVMAVGIMTNTALRTQLLETVTGLMEKASQFSAASKPPESRDSQDMTAPIVTTETADPGSNNEIRQVSSDRVRKDPLTVEPDDETIALATSVTEAEDVPHSGLGTAFFQVAWSPFKSEISARGFAARLERQVSQKFQVIKMGPGKYEVGFLFESEPQRSNVLKAISKITGFESATPPRIVGR